MEPRVFIGSSTEGKAVAEYLQLALDDHCDAVVWDQGVFGLSGSTLQSLVAATQASDFAILVLTPDDLLTKRGQVVSTARDNVIFELGLFMGHLGPQKTFIVHCREDKLEIPSDLAGITRATYRRRSDGNLAAAINPVAVKIRNAIQEVERFRGITSVEPRIAGAELPFIAPLVARYVSDVLEAIPTGRMGAAISLTDPAQHAQWSKNVLGMLVDLYMPRQTDAYAQWLRPTQQTPLRMRIVQSHNMPASYEPYEFHLDEGLAGKVWNTGQAAATSQLRQHPWWVYRDGCLSISYICVPVGPPKGPGGVLAVGSFNGFDVLDSDLDIVKVFAAMLNVVDSPLPP